MDTGGEGEGTNWEIRVDIYTLPCVKQRASGKLLYSKGSSTPCSVMIRKGEMGGRYTRELQEGTDSLPCTAETNTTL